MIAVLGSSHAAEGSPDYEDARNVGAGIARRGGIVVCGGYGGVMEAVARGAAEAGGESLGIVVAGGGEPNRWISRSETAADLSERLRLLRDLAKAWIFLPKGLGTLLELVWIAESITKALVPPRPIVFLGAFWRPAVDLAIAEATGPGAAELGRSIHWAASPRQAVDLSFAGLK